jgi:hypothetical protein
VPALRLAGFALLSLLLLLYDLAFAAPFDLRAYLAVVALLGLYALGSWALLLAFYGKLGRIDLGFVFLHADIVFYLYAIHHTGARHLWVTAILLPRVADQTYISFRRAFHRAIFGPFVQVGTVLGRTHGGTGLGLAITAHLVALMGGEIAIDSEVGRGSTFRVTLPLAQARRSRRPRRYRRTPSRGEPSARSTSSWSTTTRSTVSSPD